MALRFNGYWDLSAKISYIFNLNIPQRFHIFRVVLVPLHTLDRAQWPTQQSPADNRISNTTKIENGVNRAELLINGRKHRISYITTVYFSVISQDLIM